MCTKPENKNYYHYAIKENWEEKRVINAEEEILGYLEKGLGIIDKSITGIIKNKLRAAK